MTKLIVAILLASVTLAVRPAPASVPQPDRVRLDRAAAPSLDDLVARLLAALESKDKTALRRLRVSRREYVKIIMPGFVEPGAAPRLIAPSENDFWWSMLDAKSQYSELGILSEFGGRRYTVKEITFLKGTEEYAWYTAHKRIAITLAGPDGGEATLQMGSVVEANGAFKFVSYVRD
ncbi:MAG TPA: hypothetical protein VGR62_05665 [Candidatus Binatia bacterium]|jgi:hypothetical protein|nr:hypothetical protein [Candidatus Binatia bacterium]